MAQNDVICDFRDKFESYSKKFTWKIENFLDIEYVKTQLYHSCNFEICIGTSIYKFGCWMELNKDDNNNLSLDLCFNQDRYVYIRTNAWISDPKSSEQRNIMEWPAKISRGDYCGAKSLGNISKYKENSELFLDEYKTLTIHLEIFLYKAIIDVGKKKEILLADNSKINDYNYFATLYDNEKFSDVTLSVGDSEISAHRNILSAHSEYFACMFNSNFKEANDKIVRIEEEKVDLFKLMIKFIYTNNISEMNFDIALDLILLAQKYGFISLIATLNKLILDNMGIETCVDILSIAESAQTEELKEKVNTFIVKNIDAVMGTEKWQELEIVNPLFALKVAKNALMQRIP